MALHCIERHIQHFSDLGWVKIFLVAKNHNHARFLGQRVHDAAKHLRKEQIVFSGFSYWLRNVFQTDLRSHLLSPSLVDTAMAGDFAQPECQVFRRFDRVEILMQVEKNLLSQLLSQRAVAKKVAGHAKDHTLVLANDLLESKLVAQRRAFQRFIELGCRRLIQCYCSFPPHSYSTQEVSLSNASICRSPGE